MKNYTNQLIKLLCVSALAMIAFAISFCAGRRGFFAFDQSIVFDGGYRILSGQIPFVDFMVPFGPVVFWLQSLFFAGFGVNYTAYLLHAAVVNVLAALLVFFMLRRLCGNDNFIGFIGGLITAAWFYPPFGTPWAEQTAFFFALSALWLVLEGVLSDKDKIVKAFFVAASGFCALASFLSKQNAGLFIIPLFIIIIIAVHAPIWHKIFHDTALFVSGALISLALFAVWLFAVSDFMAFWNCVFVVPAGLGVSRLMSVHALLNKLFVTAPPAMIALRLVVVAAMGVVPLILLIFFFKTLKNPDGRRTSALLSKSCYKKQEKNHDYASGDGGLRRFVCPAVAPSAFAQLGMASGRIQWKTTDRVAVEGRLAFINLILVFYLLLFQLAFYLSSYNSFANTFAFIGIVFGLVIASFVRAGSGKVVRLISAVLCVVVFMLGLRVAFARTVHDVFFNAAFSESVQVPSLSVLRWGNPTVIKEREVSSADIEALYKYLENSGKQFFIFPDFTVFYGLLGVKSPQPLLWFHKGLTYLGQYDESLDRLIVERLKAHDVTVIVLEKVSFFGTPERLNDFPALKDFMEREFTVVQQIGIFRIMRRNDKFNTTELIE